MFKNCGELRKSDLSSTVQLRGFVSKTRHLGNLIFIDLRDRFGITQLVCKKEHKHFQLASSLKNEDVIVVKGKVIMREAVNHLLDTGEIEVIISELEILSRSEQTPILIRDDDDALEETRLKYRYLDLRRPKQKDYIVKRSLITQAFREALISEGFLELDTPLLGKSTPEGAREFLVPSRISNGLVYALPQSPQVYKQLYMVAGFDKYFQIAKCLRDEDLRADRQPEFTQIDIEMAFATPADIYQLGEKIYSHAFKKILNVDLKIPFRKMKYNDAINNYGSDKPDLRYKNLLIDLTSDFASTDAEFLKKEECITGVIFKDDKDSLTRKYIEQLSQELKKYKVKTLAWVRYDKDGFQGSIAKYFTVELASKIGLKKGQILFVVADNFKISKIGAGALRCLVANTLKIIPSNTFEFVWITDFPMFELSDEGKICATHHPFTKPKGKYENIDLLEMNSEAYDLVLNGYELASGSMRISDPQMQQTMFDHLGITREEANKKFGFFLEAFKYGCPPHGGIGFGLERTIMIMLNTNNIRDVVAFPKTQTGRDLMMDAPSPIGDIQLQELGLKVNHD